jgi:hypothetical protein
MELAREVGNPRPELVSVAGNDATTRKRWESERASGQWDA